MGDMWRSQKMTLCQLIVQNDAAHAVVNKLGTVGIVEFRKLVMATARALQHGDEPKSTGAAKKYAVRSGGWVADPDMDLAAVMAERFGHRHGYVGNEYGLGE